MNRSDSTRLSKFQLGSTITMMMVAGLLTAGGVLLGMNLGSHPSVATNENLPFPLKAVSASRGESLSMATGQIDNQVEGVFVLDHLTGNLECWVLNSRTGGLAARYRTNVTEDLQMSKAGDADYVMVTGRYFFDGGNRGNLEPGRSICYVGDGNSGKVIGYGLRFDRTAVNSGVPQEGELFIVGAGISREVLERDQ